jgi:uncharacterized CHY-type Zn-finger protein
MQGITIKCSNCQAVITFDEFFANARCCPNCNQLWNYGNGHKNKFRDRDK